MVMLSIRYEFIYLLFDRNKHLAPHMKMCGMGYSERSDEKNRGYDTKPGKCYCSVIETRDFPF